MLKPETIVRHIERIEVDIGRVYTSVPEANRDRRLLQIGNDLYHLRKKILGEVKRDAKRRQTWREKFVDTASCKDMDELQEEWLASTK